MENQVQILFILQLLNLVISLSIIAVIWIETHPQPPKGPRFRKY